jgi:hypothetical protein
MDEPKEIKRDEVLRLGGGSLLAALAAMATAGQADAEAPKHPHPTPTGALELTPVGLGFTQTDVPLTAGRKRSKALTYSYTPIKEMQIYTDPNTTFLVAPDDTYSFTAPYMNLKINNGKAQKYHLQTIYIAVWNE